MKKFFSLCVMFLSAAVVTAAEIPPLKGPVNDYAEVISAPKEQELTQYLLTQEKETSNQIVILTVKSLDGDAIESFAERVLKTWKLGQKGKDNGVLVVLATEERSMWIEVGFGLEGVLTDALASQVIRNEMAPKFKENDFDEGFSAAVAAIDKAIKGEYKADGEDGKGTVPGWGIVLLVIGVIVVLLILALVAGGGNIGEGLAIILAAIANSGGSGGGGSRGGGGYSGGGGRSGGGGAGGKY